MNNLNTILAIDTSTTSCSVALQHQSNITYRLETEKARHTAVLLPMIDDLLQASSVKINQIQGIIISAGPGAFTGLRVGAAAASALAMSIACPIGHLSSLALQAASVEDVESKYIMPCFDARMSQCYYGLYHFHHQHMSQIIPDKLGTPEQIAQQLLNQCDVIIGSGICYQEHWLDQTTAIFRQALPHAKNAFNCFDLIHWQSYLQPIELSYLRDEVTG